MAPPVLARGVVAGTPAAKVPSGLRALVPGGMRRSASRWLARRNSARLDRELAEMAARPGTIIAGPWLGEVGFELLYWVPFLAWFAERFDVDAGRLVVLSRGGTASWYRAFASGYADVFDQLSPEEFRDRHDWRVRELGEQKQTRPTDFDDTLVRTAASRLGIASWSTLHPAWMYDVLNPYWWGHTPVDWVTAHTRAAALQAPVTDLPLVLPAPGSYTAVKFYFNECFPATDDNRLFVRETLRRLGATGPVVALSTGLHIDDHDAWRVDDSAVQSLPEGIPPARNLQVQSAIVSGAAAFVGTYGGFSYLAPFYGVPSHAFYSNRSGFSEKHLIVAQTAFASLGRGGLLDVAAVDAGLPAEPGAAGRNPAPGRERR